MMKILRNKEDSLKAGLSFFLLAGALLGSIFCNKMTGEMKKELLAVSHSLVTEAVIDQAELNVLLGRIFLGRLWMFGLVFLMSATPYFSACCLLIAGYIGFSAAVLICPLTMENGVFGLWKYLLLIFPQCLIYIPVIYVILWWMPAAGKRITWPALAVLIPVIFLGAAAESLINPWFLTFL